MKVTNLIQQNPLLKYPILILLIGTFISIELFTFNYRQKGILREKSNIKNRQEVKIDKANSSLKTNGPTLFILAVIYSVLTCSILSVLYSNKFYTMLASWVHISIMVFCFVFFCAGLLIHLEAFFNVARSMLSLLLSPWLVTFFVAGFPLYKMQSKTA